MLWGEFFNIYAFVLPSILFGAFVARATGVGFALLLVAALLSLPHLDQPTALFIAAPLSLINLSLMALTLYRETPWGTLRAVSLPLLIGFLAGFVLGIFIPKLWMLIFGLGVVAYSFVTMVRPPLPGQASYMARADLGGGLTGLMTGALSYPGPPISAFMLARGFIGNQIRVTIAFIGMAGSSLRMVIGGGFSMPVPEFGQILMIGVIFIGLGNVLGWWAAQHMSPRMHRALIMLITLLTFLSLAYGLVREIYGF